MAGGTGLLFALALATLAAPAPAQLDGISDERQVPAYTLPDLLRMADGRPVPDAARWERERRPELLRLFERNIYGVSPPAPDGARFVTTEQDRFALGGLAVRKQVTVQLLGREDGPALHLLLYLPAKVRGPVPVFLGLNFHGNQAVRADPAIRITGAWVVPARGVVEGRVTESSRGIDASQWPVERILQAGYGVATFFSGDLYPDRKDGRADSIQRFFPVGGPPEKRWGAIATWAWGLSRAYDYLATDPDVDPGRVIVFGHSRYGKAALWAGARDERFAMVVSNDSGEGGASLYRRGFGETIRVMNGYWFAPRFKAYAGRAAALPVDAHALIALVAPRPAYIASASEDWWADPRGEFLAARTAEPAYRLHGLTGIGAGGMPPPGPSVGERVGYHLRRGKHDITPEDWDRFIAFADRELRGVRDGR